MHLRGSAMTRSIIFKWSTMVQHKEQRDGAMEELQLSIRSAAAIDTWMPEDWTGVRMRRS